MKIELKGSDTFFEAGPRPPGSTGIKKARTILTRQWKSFGFDSVYTEDVTFTLKDRTTSELRLSKPVSRKYDTIACINSASAKVQADIVYVGSMNVDDLYSLGEKANGSILLVNGCDITGGKLQPLQKTISLAQAAGAKAVILIGKYAELPAVFFLSRTTIPVVNISADDGKELIALCRDGNVHASVSVTGRTRRAKCANLIGELAPDSAASDIIAVCAHLDSFSLAPGAMDNLTGIVTMTAIARDLAPFKSQFKRRLKLIAFTGEEYGFAGSKQYVRQHADELDRTKFLLSMDCLFKSTAEGMAVMWSPEMKKYISKKTAANYPNLDIRNHFCMSSDYLPFMLKGVPTARPADWKNKFPPWTHTADDTPDRIKASALRANAKVYAHLLLQLLTDPKPLPSHRKSKKEIEALIQKENAADLLRWQIALT